MLVIWSSASSGTGAQSAAGEIETHPNANLHPNGVDTIQSKLIVGLCVAAFCSLPAATTRAQSGASGAGSVLLGAGVFNVLDGGDQDRTFVSLEYRAPFRRWTLSPTVAFGRAGGGATFTSLGVISAIPLGRRWEAAAGFAPSWHTARGDSDLGSAMEFYSFAEFAWRSPSGKGVRLRFGHFSNAGLGPINPGAEIGQLTYVMPLAALWHP